MEELYPTLTTLRGRTDTLRIDMPSNISLRALEVYDRARTKYLETISSGVSYDDYTQAHRKGIRCLGIFYTYNNGI